MPKAVRLIVTGIPAIDAKFRKIGSPKIVNGIIRKAFRAGLKPVLAAAKANEPKDTGALKGATKIITVRTRKGVKLAVSILGKKLAPGKIGEAAAVEYGTGDRDAQEPMKRAYDRTKAQATRVAIAEIRAGIAAALK